MSKIKLCVFDLDGTLLTSEKIISKESIKAINSLKDNNILYTIATGRLDILARQYLRQINSNLPIISCNGSLIRDFSNKIYHIEILDFEIVKNIFNYFSSLNLHFIFYTENSILCTKNHPRIKLMENYNKSALTEDKIEIEILSDNIEEYKNLKFLKALAHIEDRGKLLNIQESLNNDFKNLSIVSSDKELLDIMPSGMNKGYALSILCKILNVAPNEVCVFGDNFNDLEMIKFSGVSIVPKKGEDDIKNLATFITKSNDDEGISYGINNFILKKV